MVPDGKKKYSQTGNSARRALFFSSLVAVTFACCVMVYNLMEPDCPVARVQQEHSLMCPPRECPEQPAPAVKVEHTLAFRESLEFFDDVDDREWNMMKQKVKDIHPNTKGDPNKFDHYDELHYYWQDHYEPNFSCRHERRIGPLGDGGKWVCDAHRYKTKDCLVYSVGSNGEYGFEAAVLSEIGPHCEIHTFDFDDYSAEAIEGVNFHQWGLAEKTYEKKRGWFDAPIQLKTLQQTVEELGHTGRTISLFKIDCESCEWSSVDSWFEADVTLHQILVEVHKVNEKTPHFFETMHKNHYAITHKEANLMAFLTHAFEFVFLKLSPEFFE